MKSFAAYFDLEPGQMPKNFKDLSRFVYGGGREDTQGCWQNTVAQKLKNCTILDVGSGLGKSKDRLSINGNKVTTQDVGPGCTVDITADVSEIGDNSYDIVTAFDVIEHIVDPWSWLANLRRIARFSVVLTTPNWLVCRNTHAYHYFEYTPKQILKIVPGRFQFGWVMDPEKGIIEVTLQEFRENRTCGNYCLAFSK